MPTYEYRCDSCGHELEKLQKITESPLKKCPECAKETLQRGPGGGIGLSFKGAGFYITDYAAKKDSPKEKQAQPAKPAPCVCGSKEAKCPS